ncbi:MAG: helix-turn-helix transcriptional regulator [Nitrosomonadales bacterium]|nr:helix-turn-helix transcriptional regulator [Nitrosomonadales bacterium]
MLKQINSPDLQKPAPDDAAQSLPIQILNPIEAAQYYKLRLYAPSPELASLVDKYWVMRWDLLDHPPFTCEVIPSAYTNLTFMPGGSRITGVTTGKYRYELTGSGTIFGVMFHPGGLHPFFGKSLSELTDTTLPGEQVFAWANDALNSAMLDEESDKCGVTRIESLLLQQLPAADPNIQLIDRILEMADVMEAPTVASLCQALSLSERRVQELMREYVGVGLKWILLRSRLQKAARFAVTMQKSNWADIAAELGYSDQSHFINDFKRLIGKTPSQYAKDIHLTNCE